MENLSKLEGVCLERVAPSRGTLFGHTLAPVRVDSECWTTDRATMRIASIHGRYRSNVQEGCRASPATKWTAYNAKKGNVLRSCHQIAPLIWPSH
jgi:hypothetical protein